MDIDGCRYLTYVTRLVETCDILACEDIKNTNGLKLFPKGTRIDQFALARIVNHKLAKPLDRCLAVADPICGGRLVDQMKSILGNSNACLPTLRYDRDAQSRLLCTLSTLPLNTAITNKLSLMEKSWAKLLTHSLEVTGNALAVASLCGFSIADQQRAVLAGLLHDIGMLHINPTLLDAGWKLTAEDWHQIHAHPLIAYLILKSCSEYHSSIGRAVLEHHERMDGSGYPRGLPDKRISHLGRIVGLADTIASILNKSSVRHLICVLKLLGRQLDIDLVGKVLTSLHCNCGSDEVQEAPVRSDVEKSCGTLLHVFDSWRAFSRRFDRVSCAFYDEASSRMWEIERLTYQAMNQFDGRIPDCILDDPGAMNEVFSVIEEALYQIRRLITDVRLRCHENSATTWSGVTRPFLEWASATEELIDAASKIGSEKVS